jgi:hypothetical protein
MLPQKKSGVFQPDFQAIVCPDHADFGPGGFLFLL